MRLTKSKRLTKSRRLTKSKRLSKSKSRRLKKQSAKKTMRRKGRKHYKKTQRGGAWPFGNKKNKTVLAEETPYLPPVDVKTDAEIKAEKCKELEKIIDELQKKTDSQYTIKNNLQDKNDDEYDNNRFKRIERIEESIKINETTLKRLVDEYSLICTETEA